MKVAQYCLTLCNPWTKSPGQNTGVSSLSFLQRIFATQGSNPGHMAGRFFYQLSLKTAAMKLKDVCSLEENLMVNLDSILKSRDITLPTDIHIVKAMVFSIVMYECES